MAQARTGQRNGHSRQRPASQQAKTTSRAKPRRGGAGGKEAASRRRGSARAGSSRTSKATPAKAAGQAGKAMAKATPKRTATRLAVKLAKRTAKHLASKAAESAGDGVRSLTERAAENTGEAIYTARTKLTRRRLPIQRSIDVAVPLTFAWEEWSALGFLPEGAHTVTDIERDGDELIGRTSGPRAADWSAEILDERPEQSFAWQSHDGSDCAGLITFHRLSERLTRVELNLDVVPRSPAEAVALATRLADRRAETELRRWKSSLELINPDLYEPPEPDDEPAAPDDAPADEPDDAD